MVGTARPRALLARLLISANDVVSTDALVDDLWGAEAPPTAEHMVQVYVSRLRKFLKEDGRRVLITRDPGYLVQLGGDDVLDVTLFERVVRQGRKKIVDDPTEAVALFERALRLWRGPALADFAYERFAQAAAAQLEELRVVAEEERIEAMLMLGRDQDAILDLDSIVVKYPMREHLRAQQMLALYRIGRQAEALAVFQDARQTLARELGIDPGPELQSLEESILRHDPDLGGLRKRPSRATPHTPLFEVQHDRAICRSCGQSNNEGNAVCSRCGSALTTQVPAPDVRKTVTVIFSDVTGSTALGERLDPESLRAVMSRYFDRMKAILESHGGTVEKFIGDAIMAVFGIPLVHEDDALRACRAALEMRDALDPLNEELERDWQVTITTRTAVNTGEVIAGDPSSSQTLVTGDPVNAAARLEQAAAGGEVLIGEATYGLVREAVVAEAVEPILAKGKAKPLPAYRLSSMISGASARPRRLDSPMVGREVELRLLGGAFERTITERTCVLAIVVGVPGVGKSRLVHEFTASISGRATDFLGRCLPYGDGITFWPVSEVIHEAAAISEGDSPEEARFRIEALLPETDERALIRDRVAATIGLAESGGGLQETFWAVRKLLEAVASDQPIVVVFDDIHWAEPTFLDLIEYLEGWSKTSSILVLCLARPELLETRPEWASAASQVVIIALEPLTGEQSDRLIQNLLGQHSLSAQSRRQISAAAEGNPLFVEEILGMFIDEGRLRQEEDRWVAVDDLSSGPTPPSIQGLLAARIERLPQEQREILQRAAVVGQVFWWGAIADLTPAAERPRVASHLQAIVRKGLVQPDESAFAGEDAFRFRHILIRDASYNSLPRATRADLHERFARWLEIMVGERIEAYEEILGYHFERAYRDKITSSRSGAHQELAVRASGLLASAGRRALNREDIYAALNLLSRASELNSADDPDGLAIRLALSDALRLSGEYQRAGNELGELIERARAVGDAGLEWRAKVLLGEIVTGTTGAEFDEVRETAIRAIEIFSGLGDDWGLAKSWQLLALMRFNTGQAGEARDAWLQAAFHARSAGDKSVELRNLVLTNDIVGPTTVEEAMGQCREILDQVKGQPGHEAALYWRLGLLEAMGGHFEEARSLVGRARSIWQDLGNMESLASSTDVTGDIEWYAGDVRAEERERRAGYEALRKMGMTGYQATWAAWLARPLIDLGRDEEALELTRESEELGDSEDITVQVPWRSARAKVLARRGAAEEAERLAQDSVAIAEQTDWLNLRGDALMDLAEVLRLCGKRDEAAEAARTAAERYEMKGNVVRTAVAHAFVEQLGLPTPP